MLIDICVPVYNEEEILEANVLRLLDYLKTSDFFITRSDKLSWRLVIINNGSSDSSYDIALRLRQKNPEKIIVEKFQAGGRGLGLKGYFLKSRADICAYMDSDLAVSLEDLPALLDPLLKGEADFSLGSRLLSASVTDRSWSRELSSRLYNFFSRFILGHNFSDCQCGFKAIRTNDFRLVAKNIKNEAWFFDTEMLTFFVRAGLRGQEISVNWKEERYHSRKSKVNLLRDSFCFLWQLFSLRYRLSRKK